MEGAMRDGANCSLSSLSLPRPDDSQDASKRRLLLIYIHGFMGSEASFHKLPAHVHDLCTDLLSESHVVYTRIYPRYKSHGELRTAVDQFSTWLSPHEADDLDVILLGHSLGGILAADVALLQQGEQPKHRILGLVNFDVPFLGVHPRVIPTGIMGSIPKKDIPENNLAQEEESLGLESTLKLAPSPNFDPPFENDLRLPERGFLKGMMHFVNKNADNLSRSVFDRVVSPIKFANCVNNYSELRQRHRRLMELEAAEYSPGRVRFVNYYTTSTGRKAKTKPAQGAEGIDRAVYIEHTTTTSSQDLSEAPSVFSESEAATSMTSELTLEGQDMLSTCSSSAQPFDEVSTEKDHLSVDMTSTASSTSLNQEKSHHLAESISISPSESGLSAETPKQKLRRFILLPSDHWKRKDNSHWTPVLMENMDEVTAHQSIFIPQGANYDYLVGDMVALIEQWVQSDLSRRLLQESLD